MRRISEIENKLNYKIILLHRHHVVAKSLRVGNEEISVRILNEWANGRDMGAKATFPLLNNFLPSRRPTTMTSRSPIPEVSGRNIFSGDSQTRDPTNALI